MDRLTFDIQIAVGQRTLVDIRDFHIPRDRITFLFGESGIGKSLIARAIYGLLDPEEYTVTINREPYTSYLRRSDPAIRENGFFVFQEPSSHLNPLLPLGYQIREGSLVQATGEPELLSELWEGSNKEEIGMLLDVYPKPHRPSGGEKQRLFLVMALKKIDLLLASGANKPGLFVFDEPTGSLDNLFRNVFLSLLFKRFQQHPFTTLIITHDYSMVSEVTGTYGTFRQDVSFKELSLSETGLALSNFQPEIYLGWLNQQKREPVAKLFGEGKPLLRVESGAAAFGQRLTISKHSTENEPSSLEIFPGSLIYLKAPSGTGKTTLVKMMMGLIRGEHLRLSLDDIILTEHTPRNFWQSNIWGKKMTMVFQHADEALNPHSTVMGTFGGLPSKNPITREDVRKTLGELFDFTISDEFMNKHVNTLSGGQKQRLNLCRSLFLDTDILILDEPLNGLDFESITRVLAKLREKLSAGKGILLISHNEEIFDALTPKEHIYYLQAQPITPPTL
ncbi:MAG: ATP-binding cassette domain-containing protein [Bacteroidota bacterium]